MHRGRVPVPVRADEARRNLHQRRRGWPALGDVGAVDVAGELRDRAGSGAGATGNFGATDLDINMGTGTTWLLGGSAKSETFGIDGTKTAFGENSERVPVGENRDGAEFLNRLCVDCAVNMQRAMELQEWFEENLPMRNGEGGGSDARGDHFWRRAIMAILSFKGNQAFALQCFVLALGIASKKTIWFDILGCQDQVDLGNRWNVTKADVNKYIRQLQKNMQLESNRSEKSQLKMSQSRTKQLKKVPDYSLTKIYS
jgi:hypothetical protein